MNKLILLILLSISGISFAQVKIDDIVFDKDIVDFGVINAANGNLTVVYNFYNNGPIDFIINDVDVACGCTTPRAYKRRIPPGDSGQIVAEFNPKGILGDVTKWIQVKGNFSDALYKELKFRADISNKDLYKDQVTQEYYPGQYGYVLVMTPLINYGYKYTGYVGSDSIEVFNDGTQTFVIESVQDLPPYLTAVNLPLEVPKKELVYVELKINTELLDTIGPIGGTAHLITNDKFFPTKEFNYSITLSHDYSKLKKKQLRKAPKLVLNQTTVDLGEVKSGAVKTGQLTLTNSGKSTLEILRVEPDCTCALLKDLPKSLAAGESVTITVKFDSLFRKGSQKKGIKIYTNDPLNPITIVTIAAQVL